MELQISGVFKTRNKSENYKNIQKKRLKS